MRKLKDNTHLKKRVIVALVSCALLIAGVSPLGAQTPANEVIKQVGFDQRINEQLPLDLKFRDETGRDVELREYFGKRPVVLALVYYECPMLCTLILNGLTKSLKVVKFNPASEFEVVVVSFNPRETPEMAARKKDVYLREYNRAGTEKGWHFLTGQPEAIKKLTETVGFRYLYDASTNQYAHASGFMVATPEGKLYRYFYGIEYSPRDIRFALIEAGQNKAGTIVDQVWLYCYHYDPKTGKYGVLISSVLKLAGTSTMLLLFLYIGVSLRREKRARLAILAASSGQNIKA